MPPRLLRAAAAAVLLAPTTPAADLDQARKDLFYLAGPECEGRGLRTEGLNRAADYIADQFRRAGLKPGGKDGAFFQPFTVTGEPRLGTPNTLALKGPDGAAVDLKYGTDFTPLALGASGKVAAGLVFAGYGITSKDPAYDDYANAEAKGKWVVVLRQAPRAGAKQPPFDAQKGNPHPALASKLANAVKHGAAGVIFVNHRSDKDDDLMPFAYVSGPGDGVPVVQVKRAVLDKLLAAGGKKLADVEAAIDDELAPQAVPLAGWTAAGEVTVERPPIRAKNVVGVSEGAGPLADETVVVGAHYDHLGFGERGTLATKEDKEKPHFGADDNASGVVGLLDVARRVAARKDRAGRRVVFVAFSGEEQGLLGSRHYAKEPPFPVDRTAFMVNLDMIGRSGVVERGGAAAVAGVPAAADGWAVTQRLVASGVGTAEGLDKLVADATKGAGFKLMTTKGGTGPSDHDTFYRKGVPVLFLHTGSHRDYHRPSDTPERVDLVGLGMVADLVDRVLARVTEGERPKYAKVDERWEDPTDPAPKRAGGGPRLGIMPGNYDDPDGGVLVDDVSPGGAADKGGIRAGDVVVEIAGKPVKNIGAYMATMAGQKAGQEIPVVVLRKGQKVTVKVTPKE